LTLQVSSQYNVFMQYMSINHSKSYLYYHFIFSIKYRKPLLSKYGIDIKDIITQIEQKSKFKIIQMEVDKDHIHILISSVPTLSPTSIARKIKQGTSIGIWKKYPIALKSHFWKEQVFWARGYFVSSIGYASKDTIEHYIQTQG
jgi:REP-associated tyrosine transposase